MKNTTAEYVAELPAVNVTARSMDGTVLGTDNMVGASIMPGDCGVIGSMFSIPVTAQSDIDVSFDLEKPRLSSADSDTYPRNSDFTVKGITENTSKLFPTITGEVISHYDKHLDEVKISALLRNKGKIVSAETAFLNDLDPEKPKAFEIDLLSSPPAHDETEIYSKRNK